MKQSAPNPSTIEKTCYRVTALVVSRILGRDLHAEMERLQKQSKTKSYGETAAVLAVLFALAVVAASFGWLGLCLYFVAVIALFH